MVLFVFTYIITSEKSHKHYLSFIETNMWTVVRQHMVLYSKQMVMFNVHWWSYFPADIGNLDRLDKSLTFLHELFLNDINCATALLYAIAEGACRRLTKSAGVPKLYTHFTALGSKMSTRVDIVPPKAGTVYTHRCSDNVTLVY